MNEEQVKLDKEIKEMQDALQTIRTQYLDKKTELDQVNAMIDNTKANIDKGEARVKELDVAIGQKESALASVSSELTEARSSADNELSALASELQSQRDERDRLIGDVTEIITKKSEKEAEYRKLKIDAEKALADQEEVYLANIETLRKQEALLREATDKAKVDKVSIDAEIEKLRAKSMELAESGAALEKSYNELIFKKDELDKACADAEQERIAVIEKLSTERNALGAEIVELQSQVEESQALIEGNKRQAETILSEANEKLAQADIRLKKVAGKEEDVSRREKEAHALELKLLKAIKDRQLQIDTGENTEG